jgi:hypothetical protein
LHAVAQLAEALRYKPKKSRVRFPMVSLEIFIDIILLADSASNRIENPEYFLLGKGGWCIRLLT